MTDRGRGPTLPKTKRLRALRMGLETVLGLRRRGFFIPYRYAEGVAAPAPYAELLPVFAKAEPQMTALLGQMEGLVERLESFRGASAPSPRFEQSWFPRLDGAAAYTLVRVAPPKRVIEVGSGHSTRFVAQAIADAGAEARQICIDPAPRAALKGLDVEWRRELLGEGSAPLFAELEAGDIAFFDSSHILMPGTDVDIILNRLLPVIRPGVRVHIHDVLLPDPYPHEWSWRGYNEQNALGPLLTGGGWRVLFASHYAARRIDLGAHAPRVAALPLAAEAHETSLWLERV